SGSQKLHEAARAAQQDCEGHQATAGWKDHAGRERRRLIGTCCISNEAAPRAAFVCSIRRSMTPRRYLILAIVTLTSALGDTFLAHGMKQLGPVSPHHLSTLIVALKLPWVLIGIALLIGFF